MNRIHPRTRTALQGGFTLVEMLVALAVLLIFGLIAVTILSYGSGLWRSAHRRSYAYDTATVVFQQIQEDLSAAQSQFWGPSENAYDERVGFWVERDEADLSGDGTPDWSRQRIRFVRGIPEDTANPRLRQAGDGVSNDDDNDDGTIDDSDDADEEYYNLKDDDGDDRVDEDLMPLEGMCEVAYVVGLGSDASGPAGEGDSDETTLYRAVLGPIGLVPTGADNDGDSGARHAAMTFFHGLDADGDGDHADDDADSLGTSYRIDKKSGPLAEDILHFEVRLWTQYTTTWDPGTEFTSWNYEEGVQQCGPVFRWDHTRQPTVDPEFELDQEQPVTGDWIEDNVFPRLVMVVMVIDASEEYPMPRPLKLREPLNSGDTSIAVEGTLPAYNKSWKYILIEDPDNGHEWIRFENFEPDDQGGVFSLGTTGERPVRGTEEPPTHPAGSRVKFGYTFSRVFRNPAGREYWGQ